MPDFHVQASTVIEVPTQHVHDTLVDFTTWPDWSPWLYTEPDAQVEYTGDKGKPGHGYQWAGDKVGSGSMKLSGVAPGRIDCSLQFLKPFKSTATVWFDLNESSPDQTTLTWSMDSHLPFFLFWMTASTTAMIKADYNRGLALLKDLLETGSVQSQTHLQDIEKLDPIAYVGHQVVTSIDQLQSSVPHSFAALAEKEKSGMFTPIGNALCFYDKMVPKRNEITYTAAQPLADPVSVTQPLVSGKTPACRALKAIHTGSYLHLANAWATLMGEARYKKLKGSKSIPPFEIYLNDPDTTERSDLITELYLPLK